MFDICIAAWVVSKWFEKNILIFSFDKFELIKTFVKIVAITSSNWRLLQFFFQWFFSIKSFIMLVEISMYCDQNFLWFYRFAKIIMTRSRIYYLILNVDFHTNDLVESNYCKIDVFKKMFRRREFERFIYETLLYSLTWEQEIKFIEILFVVCIVSRILIFIFWCNSSFV